MTRLPDDAFMRLVFWLPCNCAALHIFEEFAWAGKFVAWHRAWHPEIASSITPHFAILGNRILMAAMLVLGVMGPAWLRGLSLWLILAALLAGNAVFHLLGAWRMHRGLATR